MKVQVTARFAKKPSPPSDEDKAELEVQKILNPDYKPPMPDLEFEYEQLVLDLKDIAEWIRFDDNHTQLMKYNNIMHIIKVPFEGFTEMYEDFMGTIIKKIIVDS